jgi:replicative DNA helicase
VNLYLAVLKLFLQPEYYQKYETFLDYQFLKENHPELFKIYQALRYLQDKKPISALSTTDLSLAFATLYPASKDAEYRPIFNALDALQVQDSSIQEYLVTLRRRRLALQVATDALAINEGRSEGAELLTSYQHLQDVQEATRPEDDFGEVDIVKILEEQDKHPGLRWKLGSLNKALGSLRKGNFGFVFARPETGKTTFLASEIPYMAAQAENKVIWFNNEQAHNEVMERCYMGALGWTILEVKSKREEARDRFKDLTKDRFRVVSEANLTRSRIEQICRRYTPSLIIFDQIDKIQGFGADRNDLELTAIYQWARELSKMYGPVIGICQAGQTAEGKRYLTMNDVNNSKTGKQGEADFILGIGCVPDEGLETYRYLHLCKNKLQGDKDTDPTMRHGKWEVRIRPEIARYEDI